MKILCSDKRVLKLRSYKRIMGESYRKKAEVFRLKPQVFSLAGK
jgi:hypothetical protein